MQKLSIHGGVPLSGEVRVAGAKNAALPILAAVAAHRRRRCASPTCPQLNDVRTMVAAARAHGRQGRGSAPHDGARSTRARVAEPFAPYELVKTMRASILALGPLRRALRRGARVAARRLRHRRAAGRPAHQGPRRRWAPTIAIEAGYIHATAKRLQGRAHLHGHRDRHRHREPDDGRVPRRGRRRCSRTRRASPRSCDLARCLIAMGAQHQRRTAPT